MKRRDLVKKLEEHGFYYYRDGANHDIYSDGKTKVPVPRHREIVETTAKKILKEAGIS